MPELADIRRNADLSVYLVTDRAQCEAAGRSLVDTVSLAVSGGVTAVQIREKDSSGREFLAVVEAVSRALPAHVTLLVNDRVDVFLAALARGFRVDGVHVGQSDLPPDAVRALIGPAALLGLSAATPEQLAAAAASGVVDHVGIGALHTTRTKKDAPAALGFERFAELIAVSTLPAVAIGGITAADLPQIRATGAVGAAVVSALCAAPDPELAARELNRAWNSPAAPITGGSFS